MYYFPLTLEGAIMRKLLMMVVVVSALMVSAAGAQTASKIDPRLVGVWWDGNGVYDKGTCAHWSFCKKGAGYYSGFYVDEDGGHYGISFRFTTVNGRIKFSNVENCDIDGCINSKMDERDFSFSDDGKTLILGNEKLKKYGNGEPDFCNNLR
jgi:hypothetical protein